MENICRPDSSAQAAPPLGSARPAPKPLRRETLPARAQSKWTGRSARALGGHFRSAWAARTARFGARVWLWAGGRARGKRMASERAIQLVACLLRAELFFAHKQAGKQSLCARPTLQSQTAAAASSSNAAGWLLPIASRPQLAERVGEFRRNRCSFARRPNARKLNFKNTKSIVRLRRARHLRALVGRN